MNLQNVSNNIFTLARNSVTFATQNPEGIKVLKSLITELGRQNNNNKMILNKILLNIEQPNSDFNLILKAEDDNFSGVSLVFVYKDGKITRFISQWFGDSSYDFLEDIDTKIVSLDSVSASIIDEFQNSDFESVCCRPSKITLFPKIKKGKMTEVNTNSQEFQEFVDWFNSIICNL